MPFMPTDWNTKDESLFQGAEADDDSEEFFAQLLIHVDKDARIRGNFKLVLTGHENLKVRKTFRTVIKINES